MNSLPPPTHARALSRWWPIVILAFAFALRLIGLNSRPIWYDEAFAILFSEKGFSAMLVGTLTPVQGAAADVHPIVYYTLLNSWMQLVGQSALAVRALSVFAGLLAVAVLYGIGRRLFNRPTALAGMLIAAVLPFQVDYAQEARMYAGLALFCLLTLWFFLRAIEVGGTRRTLNPRWGRLPEWVGVSVSSAAAMYMHNLAGVFLLAFGLTTLVRPKIFLKVAAAGAGAFVLWLPWFLNVPGQLAKLQQAYWVTRPDFVTLLQTALVFHVGEELLGIRTALPLALFVSLILPLLLAFQLFKARRDFSWTGALWLTALAFGTPLLFFLVSLYQPVYIQRLLLPAGLVYACLLGWLLWPPLQSSRSAMPLLIRAGLGVVLGIACIFGLVAHYTFTQFPRPHFAAADAYLEASLKPGDVVVHSNKLSFLPMLYYDRALPQAYVTDPPGSGSDTLALPTQQVLGLLASPDVETAVHHAPRVWFIIFDRAIQEYAPAPHPHLAWLTAHYTLAHTEHFDDLSIYEFESP